VAICWPPSTPLATGHWPGCSLLSASPWWGGTVARVLARRFGSLDTLMPPPRRSWHLEGVGPEIVRSLRAWSADPRGRRLVEKLRAAGVRLADQPRREWTGACLAGVTGGVTARSRLLPRDQARAAGGSGREVRESYGRAVAQDRKAAEGSQNAPSLQPFGAPSPRQRDEGGG